MGQPDLTWPPPSYATPAPVPEPSVGLVVNPALLEDDGVVSGQILPPGVYLATDQLPEGRVELFRVNGRVYTVPVVADPRLTFRFIRAVKNKDPEIAGAHMLYDVLGEAVIDALADEKLEPDEMAQVMKAVQKYTMNAMQRSGLGNF